MNSKIRTMKILNFNIPNWIVYITFIILVISAIFLPILFTLILPSLQNDNTISNTATTTKLPNTTITSTTNSTSTTSPATTTTTSTPTTTQLVLLNVNNLFD